MSRRSRSSGRSTGGAHLPSHSYITRYMTVKVQQGDAGTSRTLRRESMAESSLLAAAVTLTTPPSINLTAAEGSRGETGGVLKASAPIPAAEVTATTTEAELRERTGGSVRAPEVNPTLPAVEIHKRIWQRLPSAGRGTPNLLYNDRRNGADCSPLPGLCKDTKSISIANREPCPGGRYV